LQHGNHSYRDPEMNVKSEIESTLEDKASTEIPESKVKVK